MNKEATEYTDVVKELIRAGYRRIELILCENMITGNVRHLRITFKRDPRRHLVSVGGKIITRSSVRSIPYFYILFFYFTLQKGTCFSTKITPFAPDVDVRGDAPHRMMGTHSREG